MKTNWRLPCMCLLFLILVSGCGANKTSPQEERDIRRIALFYGKYIQRHRGEAPGNEQEFKEFIRKSNPKVNPDELLVSPRDKLPLIVVYKESAAGNQGAVVAYEKQGASGRRMVVMSTGEVRDLEEADFDALVKTR